jgi:eukaryotic-like serine/threonine-protein kinase
MPALAQPVIDDLEVRLNRYLASIGGYGAPKFLSAGGSAAVFRVEGPSGVRAFKCFVPAFLSGASGAAERRRLDVQRRLIGHACPTLVQTFRIEEAEGTAFTEMEFVRWPQLTGMLPTLPDAAVVPLILQLVEAVKFLETLNIVHRDIKPENIHVSEDFASLKLLDLGVAREFELPDSEEAAITDHGNSRPFLATAQYSSPEYLFRLDEPTKRLWSGLNFYQLGAVLHDLIAKRPLFDHEMQLGNRWLVARAVLTKTPAFIDPNPNRLLQLKVLSARCLVKDLNTRLQLVGWDDFILEGSRDPLTALRARLQKGQLNSGGHADASSSGRLEFERAEFLKRLISQIRTELIQTCGKQLPLTMNPSGPGEPTSSRVTLAVDRNTSIVCTIGIDWRSPPYDRTANITLTARIVCDGFEEQATLPTPRIVAVATISEGEDISAICVSNAIAAAADVGLDQIDSGIGRVELNGIDLQIKTEPWSYQ